MSVACRIVGHRWQFAAERGDVVWSCARGCGAGGSWARADAADARRLVAHLNRGAPRAPKGLLAALGGVLVIRPKRPPTKS